MLFYLAAFKDIWTVLNLFRYITLRAAGASVMAFLLSLWLGPIVIRWLRGINVVAHQKREYAESIHGFFAHKKGLILESETPI